MDESYYAPPTPAPANNGLAIASLVASILGVTIVPTVGSIIGVILGYVARNQIRESGEAMGGEGLAKAGIIIGWVGIGLTVIGCGIALLVGLAVPGIGICASLGNSF